MYYKWWNLYLKWWISWRIWSSAAAKTSTRLSAISKCSNNSRLSFRPFCDWLLVYFWRRRVENAISSHPKVTMVAVVGIGDLLLGEWVKIMNFVFKTRSFVLKTRSFVSKMMNFADVSKRLSRMSEIMMSFHWQMMDCVLNAVDLYIIIMYIHIFNIYLHIHNKVCIGGSRSGRAVRFHTKQMMLSCYKWRFKTYQMMFLYNEKVEAVGVWRIVRFLEREDGRL